MLVWQKKKKRDDSHRVLSEREIQEKLYGTFRAGGAFVKPVIAPEEEMAPAPDPDLFAHAPAPSRSTPDESESASHPHEEMHKQLFEDVADTSPSPRPSAGWMAWKPRGKGIAAAAGVLAATALLLWALTAVFRPVLGGRGLKPPAPQAPAPERAAPPALTRPEPAVGAPAALRSQEAPPASAPAQAPGEARIPDGPYPYYTIQVCIYESEARSRTLQKELQAQGFDSFYDKRTNRNGRSLYRVYIGKHATLDGAQDALADFMNSPVAKRFPDSFLLKVGGPD